MQTVLYWAGVYSRGGYTVSNTTTVSAPECLTSAQTSAVPNQMVSTVIGFAREQLGKPYLWGGTGPDAYDCSGLMMMAYRAGGISIPRTSQQQWAWGPKIRPARCSPGIWCSSRARTAADRPGHVGLVIGKGKMIEAYARASPSGSPVRTSAAAPGDETVVGFTRPWSDPGIKLRRLNNPLRQPARGGSRGRRGLRCGSRGGQGGECRRLGPRRPPDRLVTAKKIAPAPRDGSVADSDPDAN